ncbi:MAG: transglutaminase-like domain-containing protein [Roseburia sp.]|nr:transglutaminase-like domain-containing protein [Roseburia sp.]
MKIWNRSCQEILLFLCGNYGILCFGEALTGIRCQEAVLCLWLAVFSCGLWYFYKKNWLRAAVAVTAALLLIFAVAGGRVLRAQASHVQRAFMGEAGSAAQDVTWFFLLVMTLIALLLFLLEFVYKRHTVCCLITVLLLLAGPLFGIASDFRAVLFLALFQISPFMPVGKRACALLTVTAFALLFLPVSLHREQLYSAAAHAEHFVHNTISWATGRADEAVADGTVGRGNDYKTGTVQLTVETYVAPSEPLYLHGFSGNRYLGGQWQRADDTALLERALEILGWHQRTYNISSTYSGMYYTLNSFLSGDGIRNSRTVNVKHVSQHYRNYFEPYGGQWINGTLYSTYANTGYDYRYYEQSDMKIDWNRVPAAFERQAQWYGSLQDAYMEAVGENCLEVPRERLPRLTELCEAHPLEDFDEITAFITATLQGRTSYTQLPGNAPVNKDIVEYFLFESGKGYCQHFASAATLMYRLYGVPARYASGYLVAPSDFQLETGVYKAYVTDESAHSWVEVFIKDYGWVPIEVTPSSDAAIHPSYPGLDMENWERLLKEASQSLPAEAPVPDAEEESQEIDETAILWDIPWEDHVQELRIAAALLLYTLLLTPLLLDYRRLRLLARLQAMDCRQHFLRLIQALHYAGKLRGYDGTEEDFGAQLSALFPQTDSDLIFRMLAIVEKAAYGRPGAVSMPEEAFVKALCGELSLQLCQELVWYRRWMLRYGKGLD